MKEAEKIEQAGRRARQRAAALSLLEEIVDRKVLGMKGEERTLRSIARLRDPILPGRRTMSADVDF